MLAEMYRRRKDREQQEAIAKARADINAQWRGWLRRKSEAEAKGEQFTEPPPDEKPEGQVNELSKGVQDLRSAQRQTFWAVVAIGVAQFTALMGILAALIVQLT